MAKKEVKGNKKTIKKTKKTVKKEETVVVDDIPRARGRKIKKFDTNQIIIIAVVAILLLVCGYFLISRIIMYNYYSYKVSDNYEEVIEGLKVKKTIVITKTTEKDYEIIKAGSISIKDDFKDYSYVKIDAPDETTSLMPHQFVKKINDKIVSSINFSSAAETNTLVNQFTADSVIMLSGDDSGKAEEKYNSVDRKAFLEKNNIKTDVDLYQFIVDNYPLKTSIFDSEEKQKEAYAFNSFVDVAIPAYTGATLIKGDYTGIIFDYKSKVIEVHIYKNGKRYGFLTNDERFYNEDYLKEMISTIEIDDEE